MPCMKKVTDKARQNWYNTLPPEKKKERIHYQVEWRIKAKEKKRNQKLEAKEAAKLPMNYEESRPGYCSVCGINLHGKPNPCDDHTI